MMEQWMEAAEAHSWCWLQDEAQGNCQSIASGTGIVQMWL
jgi:hypothetical protein